MPPLHTSRANDADRTSGKELERLARTIHPGEWAVEQNRPIGTLLGSCVAVCLYDPKLRFGGMNHFMLPKSTRSSNSDFDEMLCGDFAMEVLVNAMLARGANKGRLVAKAFGGGNIIDSIRMSIGDRNIRFAKEWLEREEIPLIASDFGGPWSRKIIFDAQSGDAYCKRGQSGMSANAEIARQEAAYESTLTAPPKTTTKKVELF